MLEVVFFVLALAVGTEAGHGGEGEFLAGVFVHLVVEGDHGILPITHNGRGLCLGHCSGVHPEEFLNLAVGPGPLVGVVVRVHLAEAPVYCLYAVHLAGLYVVHQPHHLAARGDQAADIHPKPVSNLGIGLEHGLEIRIRGAGRQVLEPLDQGITQELLDAYVVVAYALLEGAVRDLGAVERVQVRQLPGGIAQVVQGLEALEHLLDGEGAQQVVVDAVQLVRVLTGIAAGPLLRIAYGAHAAEVHPGSQEGSIVLLDEVREGQVGGVRVCDVAAHHQRERPYACRP